MIRYGHHIECVLPPGLAHSFIPALIDQQINIENQLLDTHGVFDEIPVDTPIFHTYCVVNPNCQRINRVILHVHGFRVSNEEGYETAVEITRRNPQVAVICFAIPGLMTLTPDEARKLFTNDATGSFIPFDKLYSFYRHLAAQCAQHRMRLDAQGNSFGAQLLLQVLIQISDDNDTEHSLPLPTKICLLAPYLEPTPELTHVPLAGALLKLDRLLGAFNLVHTFMKWRGYDIRNHVLHSKQGRSIPTLTRQPLRTLETLLNQTTDFEARMLSDAIPSALRKRIAIIVDKQDPILAQDAIEHFKRFVVSSPNQITLTDAKQHIEERPTHMARLTVFNGERLNKKCEFTTLDALLHFLDIVHLDEMSLKNLSFHFV